MYSWIHLILAVAYENLPLLLRKCCYEMHGEGIESTQITYCRRLIHLDAFINLTRSRYRVLKLSDVIYYINHDFLQAHYTKRKARYYLKMMFICNFLWWKLQIYQIYKWTQCWFKRNQYQYFSSYMTGAFRVSFSLIIIIHSCIEKKINFHWILNHNKLQLPKKSLKG